jgi:hypothetical protein
MITELEARKIKLSFNFTLWEFLYSEKAYLKGYMLNQLDIPDLYILNLTKLCKNVLQPLRNEFKMPIKICSGYRSPELNAFVKGVKNSEHMKGKAVDIVMPGVMPMAFNFIKNRCEFRQLIDEQHLTWIHVSYDQFDNKKQILYL